MEQSRPLHEGQVGRALASQKEKELDGRRVGRGPPGGKDGASGYTTYLQGKCWGSSTPTCKEPWPGAQYTRSQGGVSQSGPHMIPSNS
jgi:hypothetical protein